MRCLLIGAAVLAVGLGVAPVASANDIDCYTQDTYGGGTRTTCYYGFPSYDRTIETCDTDGHCTTRGVG